MVVDADVQRIDAVAQVEHQLLLLPSVVIEEGDVVISLARHINVIALVGGADRVITRGAGDK